MKKLRVGTRKSLLSARQTEMALAALAKAHPALETEIVPFHTRGDLILDKPLWAISNQGKGVFASEYEFVDDGRKADFVTRGMILWSKAGEYKAYAESRFAFITLVKHE